MRPLLSLVALGLFACGLEDGTTPRATVRLQGAYAHGDTFADGELTFDPGGFPLGDALAGMRRGERRRVEIPEPACPGSPRFVEFGDPSDGEGSNEHFRYRTDRGALVFEVELTGLCMPVYGVLLPGHFWSSRSEIACRPMRAIPPTLGRDRESVAAPSIDPEQDLDEALLRACHGHGKDRDEAATVRALLEAGADPNAADAAGRSALALAAETGNRAIPRLLYLAGARLARSRYDGPFALHRAAADGQREILRALLAGKEQNPDAIDECGLTALQWALRNESSPLSGCVASFAPDYEGVLVELLERSVDVRVPQEPSSDAGACVGVFRPPGATALHYAAASCHEGAVDLLLAQGADPEASDDTGETPLMLAAQAGCPAVVARLLARGARLETQDDHGGGSALVHAVTRDSFVQDNVETVSLLLEHGAAPRHARESIDSWLDSPTGRGFGRKGLRSARAIQRMLWWSDAKGVLTSRLSR